MTPPFAFFYEFHGNVTLLLNGFTIALLWLYLGGGLKNFALFLTFSTTSDLISSDFLGLLLFLCR